MIKFTQQCCAITYKNKRCERDAILNGYCTMHYKQQTRKRIVKIRG